MKKILLVLVLLSATRATQAQTWNEWFKQKKTQLKYLQQQIIATQALIGQVRKGYAIAESGLGFIGQVKDGHWRLDETFFTSLKRINPNVRGYSRVVEIVELSTRLAALSRSSRQAVRGMERLSPEERRYIDGVFSQLVLSGLELTEMLVLLLSPDEWQLSDGERLERIDGLFAEMKERYVFAQHFAGECRVLLLQREKETVETMRLRALYGFPAP